MCTAFVRKGKDVIVGFNMDINMGAVDYDVYVEPDQFYVGVRPAGVANAYPELIDNYERNGELPVIRIQGIMSSSVMLSTSVAGVVQPSLVTLPFSSVMGSYTSAR